MIAQETIVKDAVGFADRHGVIAFILVAVLVAVGLFIWRIWKFATPLFQKWVEANIDTTNRNAMSLELIGAAVTATEKSNELIVAKVEGVGGNVEEIQNELNQVKEKIVTIEQKLDK